MELNQPSTGGGSSSLTVTDGITPVVNVSTLTFVSGAIVTNGGGGNANVTVTAGTGSVTSVSVVSTNGFAGSVANPTTTPAITIRTTITGLLKGNGTAISAAAANVDYQVAITLTTTGTSGAATFDGTTLNIPQYSGGSFSVMLPLSGIVDGVNKVFVWASAPSVIVSDNASTMNKKNITPDLTDNWTGTTTTTLNVAPTFNIYAY